MGIGIALGGVAKGLESAENARDRARRTDLFESGQAQDFDLKERGLALQQRKLDFDIDLATQGKIMDQFNKGAKLLSQFVQGSRENNDSPEKTLERTEGIFNTVLDAYAMSGATQEQLKSFEDTYMLETQSPPFKASASQKQAGQAASAGVPQQIADGLASKALQLKKNPQSGNYELIGLSLIHI